MFVHCIMFMNCLRCCCCCKCPTLFWFVITWSHVVLFAICSDIRVVVIRCLLHFLGSCVFAAVMVCAECLILLMIGFCVFVIWRCLRLLCSHDLF